MCVLVGEEEYLAGRAQSKLILIACLYNYHVFAATGGAQEHKCNNGVVCVAPFIMFLLQI